jgi:cobalt-zinc-cadmium efflux system outer membrane protein
LRQAATNIQQAQGIMIQAGVYNNPILGYSSSAESFTNGSIMGPSISQTIVTMGKLKLAQAAARMDLAVARLAYRRAETDLMASVRSAYFQVLVNEEGMKANRALIQLTDEVYKVMIIQLHKGQVAGYEPAQVAVYAGQARMAYIQSRTSYLQSWKYLATAIGLTMMPATELAGSVTRDFPRFDFDKALDYVLRNHTDARIAMIGIEKARHLLRLAQVTPVPDVTLGAGVIYDATPGANGNSTSRMVPGVTASLPLPIFNRNQGGIQQAQGALFFANEEPHRVQNALTNSFVDAYARLEQYRQFLELYYGQLLPQQIQAFRATVKRHYTIGPQEVGLPGSSTSYLTDMIAAEQNVVSLIGSYLQTLSAYWQAASDTASLFQTDSVYDMASDITQMPEPDLSKLLSLPCCHPCSSLPVVPGVQPATGVGDRLSAIGFRPETACRKPKADPGTEERNEFRSTEMETPPLPIHRSVSLGAPTLNPENRTEERFEGGTR